MCRLALMNRAAVTLLGKELDTLFVFLENTLGGDGNGIGLLSPSGQVKVRKGVSFRAPHAAGEIRFATGYSGATWALFHTRLATTAPVTAKFCHPFASGQRGPLILAHNGHDELFARLGRLTGKSDSALIAATWAREQRPLEALQRRRGVFLGFHQGSPFVIKGQQQTDLVLASQKETGALLFASQIPEALRARFDSCIDIGRFTWQGGPLDLARIERRPASPSQEKRVASGANPAHLPLQEGGPAGGMRDVGHGCSDGCQGYSQQTNLRPAG